MVLDLGLTEPGALGSNGVDDDRLSREAYCLGHIERVLLLDVAERLGKLSTKPIDLARNERGAYPAVRFVLDMLTHSTRVRADALVQLDEVKELHHVPLLGPEAFLNVGGAKKILQIEEEVVHPPVSNRA